jgi:hypothetical protein
MSEAEERLLTRMKELAPQRGYSWVGRLPEAELARVEAMLGFPLPPLLRRVYLEVGEGTFGLSPLYAERSNSLAMPLVDSYLELRSDQEGGAHRERRWPENLLIMYQWGCNIYSCLDCLILNIVYSEMITTETPMLTLSKLLHFSNGSKLF